MRISYAITVCTEVREIQQLLLHLKKYKREEDEIVVLYDKVNGNELVEQNLSKDPDIVFGSQEFNGNFSLWKNILSSYCTGDFIFQIDADELPHYFLLENLPYVLENSDVDLITVSRINTVEGLTEEHTKKWGWHVDENGWVNFPDRQSRIYKNRFNHSVKNKNIKWEGKVHETIKGFDTYSALPKIEEWCLYHHKSIDKQEQQNAYYETL